MRHNQNSSKREMYSKKQEKKTQIKNLTLHLKKQEQEEQSKSEKKRNGKDRSENKQNRVLK